MNDLALVLHNLNRLKQSEKLHREALIFRKANLLPNDFDISVSMNDLAGVLIKLNKLKQAEKLFREALNFQNAYFKSSNYPLMVVIMLNLAYILF